MAFTSERGPGTLHALLRRRTSAQHDHVETLAGGGMLASRDGYVRFLNGSYSARAALEPVLDAAGAADVFAAWPGRRIAALIAADLGDLGERPPGSIATAPEIAGRAELLGSLYVVEGSSLGARVLVNSVQAFGMIAAHGARHLHHQASDRSAWRQFMTILDGADLDAGQEELCVHAASRTFDLFAAAYRTAAA